VITADADYPLRRITVTFGASLGAIGCGSGHVYAVVLP